MRIENKQKICFVPSVQFVTADVWSSGQYCPSGCFVLPDVLSLRTFCPMDIMYPDISGCSAPGHFVSGHFAWAGKKGQ
jgi:hypothetical protein